MTLQQLNSGMVALQSLCEAFFSHDEAVRGASAVKPEELSTSYNKLLVHAEHMTTRLQEYHGRPVALHVLQEGADDQVYARSVLLTPTGSAHVAEFGVVRMQLPLIPAGAREEIRERKAPLGDILIRHDVFRVIDPKWYFRFDEASPFVQHFADPSGGACGRVGIIHCNGQPAIQLLEVVTDAKETV